MGSSNFEHTPQTKFAHGTTASQKATVRAFDKFYRYIYFQYWDFIWNLGRRI